MAEYVRRKPIFDRTEALALRNQGWSDAAIGERFGRTAETVVNQIGRAKQKARAAPAPKVYPVNRRNRRHEPQGALALLSGGLTASEVARELGCSREYVYRLIREARQRELFKGPPRPSQAVPHFPDVVLTPASTCDHDENPFRPGDPRICMVCGRSGFDWHPAFANVRPLPPEPEKKLEPSDLAGGVGKHNQWSETSENDRQVLKEAVASLTRREKRRLAFAAREAERARLVMLHLAAG